MLVGLPSLGTNLLSRQEFDGNWGIASLPRGREGNRGYMGRMPFCISNQCKNPQTAWKFASYLLSKNVLFPYAKRIGVLPPPQRFDRRDIMLNTHPVLRVFARELDNTMPWDIDSPNPLMSMTLETWQPTIQHALQRAVTGSISCEEACQYATMAIQDLMRTK